MQIVATAMLLIGIMSPMTDACPVAPNQLFCGSGGSCPGSTYRARHHQCNNKLIIIM